MTNQTDIPKGYKQTKVGVIPEDWEATPFKSVSLSSAFGPRFSSDLYSKEGNIATLRTTDMDLDGNLDFSNMPLAELSIEDIKNHILQKNDLVVSRSGTIGVTAVFNSFHIPVIPGAFLIRFRLNPLKIESEYLKSYFNSTKGKRRILNIAGGGVQKNLSGTSLLNLIIPIPPLPEQQKIAEILTTWDKSIENVQLIIDNLKLRNKGLAQQLLIGKKRLKGFDGEWKSIKINEILRESRDPSYNPNPSRRISVKLNLKGVEKREERGTEAKDSTAYFIRKAGQFIYGRQNLHKGALGIIPIQLDGFESTQDIPAFDFTDKVDCKWFLFFMSREKFYAQLENIATGTGSKRIHPKNLFKISIPAPTLKEQSAIASFLEKASLELKLYEKKLATLKEQKKGLMQKLLTGQIRVKTDD